MATRRIGKVMVDNTALFLCDMQEKFRPTIKYFPQIVEVSARMLSAAKVLKMPIVTTEQYPKGLGRTVPELNIEGTKKVEKTCFTMLTPEIEEHIKNLGVKRVVLCGIETQACIQSTALDLLEKEIDVHVIVDACSSRSLVDRMYAFKRMRQSGAFITTSESMILQLVRDAAHPQFREIQKIIWESAPDTGLLSKK
ncbi:isochorismatase domain-containing protein 2-like [Saccoglossus kowalevskii]|uniref:Isochorismatase domain-containing protein 2, mitochondrial-like n=1 Tax=Saccoglossus kowalevskii TaxID=10224 RepID=A0ABM0GWT1_SACKO|nr:PREDICTED: isochorismatase domain-containing protein 2, mitochondrial-like [Saccoglossus kowalevskii]